MSLTSAFTVLEEEVKRSEMWKLTCQECKINTISAGKRKKKKKKGKQWEKKRPYWVFFAAFENLELFEMSSTRAIKTCQKCKTPALSP